MGADGVGSENGSSRQLGHLVAPQEQIENIVIRQLGMELAQSRVDCAFAQARLLAARQMVSALMADEALPKHVLGTLLASLS